MTQMFFEDLEGRRSEIERHEENAARIAEAFARLQSTGQGSIEFEEKVDFELTFVEEPYMSYGALIDLDALDDLLDNEPGTGPPEMPVCSGFVTDWDQDDRGYYTGAWVGVRVWFPYEANVDPMLAVEIVHHFTFKAIAMKDVPIDVRD